MGKGLVILHLDGVGHAFLTAALAAGRMPNVSRLIEDEGYEALPYRCGIPSTTPFCQAGILYGNNDEIPSYRWWDKPSGQLVAFGHGSSFRRVAHRYFEGCEPLTEGGAVIGSCYPAGARDTFGLAYRERDRDAKGNAAAVLLPFFSNPVQVLGWARHGAWAVAETAMQTIRARAAGHPAARAYVISDVLEEIFLHHVARFAVLQAMDRDFPTIYAGFYAYDETSHGFGPEDAYSNHMLGHVDRSIGDILRHRRGRGGTPTEYEVVVLSDHGQIETRPFNADDGRTLGEIVSGFLPDLQVQEYKGKKYGPAGDPLDGHVALTYSGGLAHLYFTDLSHRLDLDELDRRHPGLADGIAALSRVAFVMVRQGDGGVLVTSAGRVAMDSSAGREVLARYDDPALLGPQLAKLNSFERAGDLVIFGGYREGVQYNFEHQVGGHGSIGGDQCLPFLLVKRDWGVDASAIRDAAGVYPVLRKLRGSLA
ncbi:MAG: hypothetical protein NVS9B1_22580 [Candidatus Dormibacteraceae bacterium]